MEGDNIWIYRMLRIQNISIHSLRMEGDCVSQDLYSPRISFQSTPSAWRETRAFSSLSPPINSFQSTPSAWRETENSEKRCLLSRISIHSLRMEGDTSSGEKRNEKKHFNPLPPHGGRHPEKVEGVRKWHFNPLPPHGGRRVFQCTSTICGTFQSTPSAWRETWLYRF